MKFVCLGYIDIGEFGKLPESERNARVDACFAYDDVLRKDGHFAGGEGLQPASTAVTLRSRGGKVIVTDGPYAETKEQLGGYHLLECKDLDEALAIAKRIPTIAHGGTVEVRPLEETW